MAEKKSFIQEFKEFALKGNVVDMAVGVIIGGAFGKIVSSLVADILMPLFGLLIGGIDFKDLKYVIQTAVKAGDKVIKPEIVLAYGNFIQVVIDFLIIAISIFTVIKIITRLSQLRQKEDETENVTPTEQNVTSEPSVDIQLLTEIRDLLKEKKE